jgi:hypothetical protein
VRSGEDRFRIGIEQLRQKLQTRGERNGKPVNIIGARLRGDEISFTAFDPDGSARLYQGRLAGDRLEGESGGYSLSPKSWTATRD